MVHRFMVAALGIHEVGRLQDVVLPEAGYGLPVIQALFPGVRR